MKNIGLLIVIPFCTFIKMGLVIVFLLFTIEVSSQQKTKYIPYEICSTMHEGCIMIRENNLYGFINQTGKLLIPCKFEYADSFSDGLSRVKINDLYGYIDKEGTLKIQNKYRNASGFHEGTALVLDEKGNNIIDKNGKILFGETEIYSLEEPFHNGMAMIWDKRNGGYGFINREGKITVPPIYYRVHNFSEETCVVQNNKYLMGLIDKNGNLKIAFKYLYLRDSSEGLIVAMNRSSKMGVLNSEGETIIPFKYEEIESFSDGLSCVKIDKKFGYIDRYGASIIPCKYSAASSFSEGFAKVCIDRVDIYDIFINKDGKIYSVDAKTVSSFNEGLAIIEKDNADGVIDSQMNLILSNDSKYRLNNQGAETYLSDNNSSSKTNLKSTNSTNFSSETDNGHGTWVYSSNNNCKFFNKPWPDFKTFTWSGNCESGYCSGQGKIVAYKADGSFSFSFDGNFVSGKANGYGIQINYNGSKYEGYVVDGSCDGEGKSYVDGKLIYAGSYKKDKKHGKGTYHYSDGIKYIGEWQDGERSGKGKLYDEKGKLFFEGEFKNDKKNGSGCYYWDAGSKYQGNWLDNNQEGQGTYYYSDGSKYVGTFADNKFNGMGKFYLLDGFLKYEGNFKNGLKHGSGIYYNENGSKYMANWVDGKKEGLGTYCLEDGSRMICNYVNDQENGYGELYNNKGEFLSKLEWDNGKFKRIKGKTNLIYTNSQTIKEIRERNNNIFGLTNSEISELDEIAQGLKNNKKNGFGELYNQNHKLYYSGNFVDGEKSGQGTYFFDDGEKYVGEFKSDKMTGYGSYFDKDGFKLYEGYFQDGEFNGEGIQYFKNDKTSIKGTFRDSRLFGFGYAYFPNGSLAYKGFFNNSHFDGDGSVYSDDGSWAFDGVFKDHELIRKTKENQKIKKSDWSGLAVLGGLILGGALIYNDIKSSSSSPSSSDNSNSSNYTSNSSNSNEYIEISIENTGNYPVTVRLNYGHNKFDPSTDIITIKPNTIYCLFQDPVTKEIDGMDVFLNTYVEVKKGSEYVKEYRIHKNGWIYRKYISGSKECVKIEVDNDPWGYNAELDK